MVLWETNNGSLCHQKWFFNGITVKNLLKHLYFRSVPWAIVQVNSYLLSWESPPPPPPSIKLDTKSSKSETLNIPTWNSPSNPKDLALDFSGLIKIAAKLCWKVDLEGQSCPPLMLEDYVWGIFP